MSKVSIAGGAPTVRLVAPTAALASGLLSPLAAGAPGDLDPSFGDVGRVRSLPNLAGPIWALALGTDDDVLLAGTEEYCGYYADYCDYTGFAARLNADGGLDSAFAAAKLNDTIVRDMLQQPDGKAVAVGSVLASGRAKLVVFRLRPDGSLDPDFSGGIVELADPGGQSQSGTSLALDTDGRIIVAGVRNGQLLVLRLLPSGALDLSFGSDGYFTWGSGIDPGSPPRLIRWSTGGYRVVVGAADGTSATERTYRCRVLALTASGALDAAFGGGGVSGPLLNPAPITDRCSAVVEQPGNGIVVGGTAVGLPQYGFVARLTPTGALDAAFDASAVPASMTRVTALAVGGQGSIVVAGDHSSGLSGALVVRLQADGHLDTLFGRNGLAQIDLESDWGASPTVHDMKVRSDGSIVAAGSRVISAGFGPFVARLLGDTGAGSPGVLGFETADQFTSEADGSVRLRVHRIGGRMGAVSVAYATAPDLSGTSATDGNDYTAVQGRLTWADGDDAEKEIVVPILANDALEGPEALQVRLSNPQGGAGLAKSRARIEIRGDAYPAGRLEVDQTTSMFLESTAQVVISVSRLDYGAGAVSALLTVMPGTATPGQDYQAVGPVRLTWSDNDQAPKTVVIPIIADTRHEKPESFSVSLTDPTGGALLGTRTTASIQITDDDPAGGGGRTGGGFLLLAGLAALARRLRPGAS